MREATLVFLSIRGNYTEIILKLTLREGLIKKGSHTNLWMLDDGMQLLIFNVDKGAQRTFQFYEYLILLSFLQNNII